MDETRTPLHQALEDIERSYAWLGRQLAVSRATVKRWADGTHEPDDETKARIARTLQRTGADLGWPEIDPIDDSLSLAA